MTGYSAKTAHREIALEQHLADRLVASQGYVRRNRRIMTGRLPSTVS